MKFAPIEGEFWIVEMQTAPDDPDYHGPFPSMDEAVAWGRSKGKNWGDFVTIHVFPPHERDESLNDEVETVETPEEPSAPWFASARNVNGDVEKE